MGSAKVRVSPKYQIVIPKEIREELKIEAGQELLIYILNGRLEISLPSSTEELRGIAKGIQWRNDYRDRNDRF
jgi:AbrB family looped-hinge helix DNA binding protein